MHKGRQLRGADKASRTMGETREFTKRRGKAKARKALERASRRKNRK